MNKNWEYLEHTADIKIRVWGESLANLFEQAALALSSYIVDKDLGDSQSFTRRNVEVESSDRDALFVDWLSEILLISSITHQACVSLQIIDCSETRVKAIITLAPITAIHEVKAITYNDLHLAFDNGMWSATVTLDI